MSDVVFMSQEHVSFMNGLLESAPEVRAACTKLTRPRVMSYRLADGPEGQDVHWAVSFDDTVRFSLVEPSHPDVSFVGDWACMIRASRSNRDGEPVDPGVTVQGDMAILAEIGPVLRLARSVATLDVESRRSEDRPSDWCNLRPGARRRV